MITIGKAPQALINKITARSSKHRKWGQNKFKTKIWEIYKKKDQMQEKPHDYKRQSTSSPNK